MKSVFTLTLGFVLSQTLYCRAFSAERAHSDLFHPDEGVEYCIDNNKNMFRKLGKKSGAFRVALKEQIKLDDLTLAKGCTVQVGFKDAVDRTSEESENRYIQSFYCEKTPAKFKNLTLRNASFDQDQCLLNDANTTSPIRLCGRDLYGSTELHFHSGRVDCKRTQLRMFKGSDVDPAGLYPSEQ